VAAVVPTTCNKLREFPTTGQLRTPRDDVARDSAFYFFRASGVAASGRFGGDGYPVRLSGRLTREQDVVLCSRDEARSDFKLYVTEPRDEV
jgi:hypothetical protein